MPKRIEGTPSKDLLNSPQLLIEPTEEKRMLEQALAAGIGASEVGTFYVVLAADVPANVDEKGYDLFSEEELRGEANKQNTWFYDEDKRRLIGTIPSVKDIVSRMRTNENSTKS
ncbi:MAG: hypothetical protein HQK96_20430 [Nitrospirae bacterium]|nr:hypothetical protein [Nitrospirota bacterium]